MMCARRHERGAWGAAYDRSAKDRGVTVFDHPKREAAMKIPNCLVFALAGALLCAPAVYAASSSASGNVSATCKDGSSWSGKSHSGACRGHGGVQGWSDSGAAATTS
ncbi:MAG: hypothetical protein C4338_04625, partial [Rhodanobacteraceae bacterium]